MRDNRWHRVEELFRRAVELVPGTRSEFLDDACRTDPSLRREVASLLAHDKEAGTTFANQSPAGPPSTLVSGSLSVGDRLGPYEIAGLIGQGGMGEVYRARDTRLNRIVAIKVSKGQYSERFGCAT
jgi:serine/threonine protein kinase